MLNQYQSVVADPGRSGEVLMEILYKSPGQLRPYEKNPKKHPKSQIRQLKRSIEHFGFTLPILITPDDGIIAGHGRVEAAIALGLPHVPTVVAEGWSEEKIRAFVIADNKLAENSEWDQALLKSELAFLRAEFEIPGMEDMIGFDESEIADLLREATDPILVPEGSKSPGKKGLTAKVGDLAIPCTREEIELLGEALVAFRTNNQMSAGFVGWLAQQGLDELNKEEEEDQDDSANTESDDQDAFDQGAEDSSPESEHAQRGPDRADPAFTD